MLSKHAAAGAYVGVLAKTAMSPADVDAMKGFGKTLLEVAPTAIPVATLAAQGIGAVITKMTEASRRANAYKAMVEQNPHLLAGNRPPEDVQRYFNTLHRFNPELASDPFVAASFVNDRLQQSTPMAPHFGLYEQAKQLAAMKKPEPKHTFGKDLRELAGTMLTEQTKRDRIRDHANELRSASSYGNRGTQVGG